MKKLTLLFKVLIIFLSILSILIIPKIIFATGTVYFCEDFDNPNFPPNGWAIGAQIMTRTTYCSAYGTGTGCVNVDFYHFGTGLFYLYSRTFPATTVGDSLSFDHAYTCQVAENDQLAILTSTDGGLSFDLLVNLNGGPSGQLTTAPPTIDAFIPTASQWATKHYALPVGTNKIKFEATAASGNMLYFDNVTIGTKFVSDVGATAILNPKWGFVSGTYTPSGTVKNFGTTAQSFTVTLSINPGNYSNTQTISNLASGQKASVNYLPFNFANNGIYTLKVFTNLSGDQYHNNDTLTNTVVVTPLPRNPVQEFSTGTWCTVCPCADKAADTILVHFPNTIIIAYHGSGNDPFQYFNGNQILNMLGFYSFPTGAIDRTCTGLTQFWGVWYLIDEYRLYSNPSSTVDIAITGQSYNAATRVLSVNLNATALFDLNSTYNLNYLITEDHRVYPQQGGTGCPGSPTYVHKWVTRNMINGASGDTISTGVWNKGITYSRSFSTTIDTAWIASNCKLSIFIYDAVGGVTNYAQIQSAIRTSVTNPIGIKGENSMLPNRYILGQNYPNPFNPKTNIHIEIPSSGNISLKIYNSLGQLIETFLDGYVKAGYYNAEFDGTNLPSGIYFYTMISKEFVQAKKMILLK